MCRISGLVGYDPALIDKMLVHQHAGGPDHAGWQFCDKEKQVVFGNNRLAIVGGVTGNQPMETGKYVITFNGEIYNYRQMRDDVALKIHGFAANYTCVGNDTKTFLDYIECFGLQSALEQANGMFAFALYDKIERTVTLAVDRFGQKPLYFTMEGQKMAFASSPAALTVARDKWEINRDALLSYFQLGAVQHGSIWAGMDRVCAGEMVVFDTKTGGIARKKWYSVHDSVNKVRNRTTNTAALLPGLVIDAINRVMPEKPMPAYLFLSGGVDSTMVASCMRGGYAVHLNSPEREYAESAASAFDMTMAIADDEFFVEQAHIDYCVHSGEPSAAAHIPWAACRRVAELGGKVAVTANGADELFFGYPRTSQLRDEKQEHHMLRAGLALPWHPFNETQCARRHELAVYVQHDLCRTLDFAAACHGIEVRAPFLDHRLVEYALAVPEREHRQEYGDKTILKRMLSGMGFTDRFIKRQKIGFSIAPDPKHTAAGQAALQRCIKDGYLAPMRIHSARDQRYLENAAFAFQTWLKVWRNKILR